MNADTPAASVRKGRIAVDNWNLSSWNMVAAGAVRARPYPEITGARLMPRQKWSSTTRLFEFSITYKAFPETDPLFGRNTLCRSVSACLAPGYARGGQASSPTPLSSAPCLPANILSEGFATAIVRRAGWGGVRNEAKARARRLGNRLGRTGHGGSGGGVRPGGGLGGILGGRLGGTLGYGGVGAGGVGGRLRNEPNFRVFRFGRIGKPGNWVR